jgi:hypothetical protein
MVNLVQVRRVARHVRALIPEIAARRMAAKQIRQIEAKPDSPFRRRPRPRYLRGIDFYDRHNLLKAMARSMREFRAVHGKYPSLAEPLGFNEKILWRKFFAEFRIPESGNKLLTARFIPENLQGVVECPPIVWRSSTPELPSNDEIPAGTYYLKANHGSGMVEKACFPLAANERSRLEKQAGRWLSADYGAADGEWWYNVFQKELMIEAEVPGDEKSIAFMFHTFQGDIGLITAYRKTGDERADESVWLSPDFMPLPQQWETRQALDLHLRDDTKARLKSIACCIGRQFSYVRVDFLLDRDERPFLGEITFTPNNGMMRWPIEIDSALGAKWVLDKDTHPLPELLIGQ